MKILKALRRLDELAILEAEKERRELERRETLMLRLNKSRYNNLKLFSLKPKGDNVC
jgi:hypothetical protein